MQLSNEFTVAASAEETWRLLTDLQRVAPCMPGATMIGRDGEDYLGTVKIKVGPIGANFEGKARFLSQDDAARTASISMAGKDTKGAASANATIHAKLEPLAADSTRVYVNTDLDITGRMAQFGRGAIADVSNRLIRQFTDNLSREILANSAPSAPASADPWSAAHPAGSKPTQSPPIQGAAPQAAGSPDLNLLSLVGPTVLKQVGAPVLGFVLGFLFARAFPGRRR